MIFPHLKDFFGIFLQGIWNNGVKSFSKDKYGFSI